MKILDWIRGKREHPAEPGDGISGEEISDEELTAESTLDRDDVDMHDEIQRGKYIESCVEQAAEASAEMKQLESEYQTVDAYLRDMEEVELMEGADRQLLEEHAQRVSLLSKDSSKYEDKKHWLKASDFKKMRRLEADAQEGIEKLREAEKYQDAIRQDLRRLEGEKQAYLYRQEEASAALSNYRGMTVILICAIFVSILLLLFLQFGLKLDASVGYVFVMLGAGITLFTIYLKFSDNKKELRSVSVSLNKLIALQNRVKIRYVNNTNLLDYLYLKYEIPSADSLEKLWKQYEGEKEERLHMQQLLSDLDYHMEEMVKLLKRYQLHDPLIWTRQAEAILDQREMVEVRHKLITRRQKLRRRMEYNQQMAEAAQTELKELESLYPEYAQEIHQMADAYENKPALHFTDRPS